MFNLKVPALALAAAAVLLIATPAAHATPITYDFTVTATTGPLTGNVANGSFTFDSSSVTPGARNANTNLLTNLVFTWDGITYTAATANTGSMTFDSSGRLRNFSFGNACSAGSCSVAETEEKWYASLGIMGDGVKGFAYSVSGPPGTGTGYGNVVFSLAPAIPAPIPEPGNLALFGGGLLLMLGSFEVMRRRQRAI